MSEPVGRFDLGSILREFGFNGGNVFTRQSGGGSGVHFSFGGGGFGGRHSGGSCKVKGTDLAYKMTLTPEEIMTGAEKRIVLDQNGKKETVSFKVPKGMIPGKKIRLAGKGNSGNFGGPSGDLYITADIPDNSVYAIDGYDITVDREIKLTESLTGTTISVPTLEKKELSLKVPPGTKHRTKMRLKNLGFPHMNAKKRGDLYIRIIVDIPKKLTKEQIKLILSLAETGL